MWISEERKYVRFTLKTRDKEIAMKRGEEEFIRYKGKLSVPAESQSSEVVVPV
jgi:hypothetical protein